jgi:hypothetical protein
MHRYRIVAQISLILSILNLVLAAPIAVQETHEAPGGDETVVAEGMASDLSTPPSPFLTPDTMASPHYSSSSSFLPDGSTSSGYSSPYLSQGKSVSGDAYTWMLERPPRLNLNPPASLYESISPHPQNPGSLEIPIPESYHEMAPVPPSVPAWLQGVPSPHPSDSGSLDTGIPEWYYEMAGEIPPSSHPPSSLHESASPPSSVSSEIALPDWYYEMAPEIPPSSHPPSSLHESASPPSSVSSEIAPPDWYYDMAGEIPPSPQHPAPQLPVSPLPSPLGSDRSSTESFYPSDGFTPSRHPSSVSTESLSWYGSPSISDGSMSTPYLSASGGSLSSHYFSGPDGSHQSMPSSPSPLTDTSPLTEAPLDNARLFSKNMMKKLKIVAGVAVVGTVIAGIVGSQIKHRKQRDFQDS